MGAEYGTTASSLAPAAGSRRPPNEMRLSTSILQVIGDGGFGGGTTVVLGLARALAREGVDVAIASDRNSYILEEARSDGIATVGLNFDRRRNSPGIALQLDRYLRTAPDTIIHAHGARAGLPVAMLASLRRLPVVYTVHGFHFPGKPAPLRHLAKAAERYCIRHSAATVFVSEADAGIASCEGLIGKSTHWQVICNGVAPAEPRSGEEPPAFDAVYLGRLVAEKNPLLLPQILLALRPARPTLCVIGGGEYEGPLRSSVEAAGLSDQVSFVGSLPHGEAMSYLARARVMILPSEREGLPMSVIEAMQRGIPVVASDVPGTRQLVLDGETGHLVGVEDVAGYAVRLSHLLADENLRRRMGQRARQRARREFSIEQHLAAHFSLYSSLAAEEARVLPGQNATA